MEQLNALDNGHDIDPKAAAADYKTFHVENHKHNYNLVFKMSI